MSVSYITEHSAKCMLGQLARNTQNVANVFSWDVRDKTHVVVINNEFDQHSCDRLREIKKANFHYFPPHSLEILKNNGFSIKKSKGISVVIDIDLNFSGKKNRQFRNYLNRYSNLSLENSIRKPGDLKAMITEWSKGMGEKYFRNMSGKNVYFINNGFHIGCENLFVYDNDNLVSFGIISPPQKQQASYIIGKALSHLYPGLAEFTDIKLYQQIVAKYGSFSVNLGQAQGGLLKYKMKFPGAYKQIHYGGSFVYNGEIKEQITL